MVSTRKKKYKSPPREFKCQSIPVKTPAAKRCLQPAETMAISLEDSGGNKVFSPNSKNVEIITEEILEEIHKKEQEPEDPDKDDSHSSPGEKKNDEENKSSVSMFSSHCSIDVDGTVLFVIDKHGASSSSFVMDCDVKTSNHSVCEDESDEEDEDHQGKDEAKSFTLASSINSPLDINSSLYITFPEISKKYATNNQRSTTPASSVKVPDIKLSKEMEVMKMSVLTPGFEKLSSINAYSKGIRLGKRERRAERSKTKGDKWFDMAAPEVTPELKNDLSVLQMRRALDPKRFYKGNDTQALPKYFQMGKVVETAADFYHARVPKKQRKANIVEELLADAEFRKYNKRKYTEIQEKKMRQSRGAHKHMKRLKKRK